MATPPISNEELEYQLEVAKADVIELQQAGHTSAAAAYFSIQATLERFLSLSPASSPIEASDHTQRRS
ncbi:hypothetical protein [Arthrobacter cryoconiti]|uniref:Uncharacterized protein n=1 Tax=Arthrobacter cryoconiti TaxID=748907 RepID=A0ABV8R782_9MICC|nr:hypothetical protein [Arthrobacter cryoconiti]MCC9069323.1 hypothetical protein [Arthrobacter cryoconiti]